MTPLDLQAGGIDPRLSACFAAVVPSEETDDEREKAALQRAKTQLEKDLVSATWKIYRLAKDLRPHPLSIQAMAKKARGNFRSFNNWKQAHEVPKLPNLQKFAAVVGANVRVIVQDAASEEFTSGASDMSDEAATLAKWIEELPEDDQRYVRGIVDALRAKARPSERAEEATAGASRGPRK